MADEAVPAADTVAPRFYLPACLRHLLHNRWWCRKCQREVARQFEDVFLAYWRSDCRYNALADKVERQDDGSPDV